MQTLSLSDQFLAERPVISLGKLGRALNINRMNLQKIVKGYRNIPKHRRDDFWSIMRKYSFDD